MKRLCVLMPLLFLFTTPTVQAQEEKSRPLQIEDDLLKGLSGFGQQRRVSLRCKSNKNAYKEEDSYKVDAYIRMAAKIQAMGEEQGNAYLLSLSRDPHRSGATFILARMLFFPLQAPGIGQPFFIGVTEMEEWTRQPIEIVDGIPFVIVISYSFSGILETPEQYVKYCIKNCAWSPTLFKPKSQQEKQAALEKLLASPKWKRSLDKYDNEFLADQIK